MKNILFISIVLFISTSLFAQEWKTDIQEAKKIAQAEGKAIILVFQGSDWCAPCIKLDHQVFDTKEFMEYAKDNYVLLKADFPRKKKNRLSKEQQEKNGLLAEKYNPKGHFPLVVVLNTDGLVLGKLGYQDISAKEYISKIETFLK